MAGDYVARLEVLLTPTLAALPPGVNVEIKHFFSGAAAFANDRICISLTGVGLAMKLPEDAHRRLLDLGGTALRYFPKAPIKKQYVVLPAEVEDIGFWARQSIDYVLTLPAPKRKQKSRRADR